MTEEFDELDRALFALPLETPPAGLREAILRATVYAPAPAALTFERWEIAGIGGALALGVWFVILAFVNHGFATAFAADVYALALALGQPNTLTWLAAGAAVVLLAMLTNITLPRITLRNGRS